MKQLLFMLVFASSLLTGTIVNGQESHEMLPTLIQPLPLEVTVNKTTNLLFHFRIKNIDLGSNDLIAQKCNDTSLLVKAGRENFPETNLSVYTSDGKLHAFSVSYSANPRILYLRIVQPDYTALTENSEEPLQTDDKLEMYSKKADAFPSMWWGRKDVNFDMKVKLRGLYVRSDVMFFPVTISNESNIGYAINQLHFTILDKKKVKRTATQEQELKPLFVLGNASYIPGNSHQQIVFALPKFTLANKKYLLINVTEADGGRDLHIVLHNRSIIKARKF